MKVTVINGSMRRGSTWHCMDLFCKELEKYDSVEVTEFFLPKDMPNFCNGCFSCFYNGEGTCPHAASVSPVVESMVNADLIILTSSIYAMDVTGQLKALLDHLCYMWFSHRPNPKMFNKMALTITTTAGAGLGHATKTMKNSLTFWGVKRVFSFKGAVSAMKWSEVSAKKLAKIQKEVAATSKKIARAVKNSEKLTSPFFRRLLFFMMSGMMKKNTWNPHDKAHWEAQGWLSGTKPF